MTNGTRRALLKGASGIAFATSFSFERAVAQSQTPPLLTGQRWAPASKYDWPLRPLLQPNMRDSLDAKVRTKPILDARLIDDMETDKNWTASPAVKLSYTEERARSGRRSLRFEVSQRPADYIAANRLPNGSFNPQGVTTDGQPFAAAAHLKFDSPQDWTAYNRISMWCYLHPTQISITSLALEFMCDGASAGPLDPIAVHYIGGILSGEWTLLTWEIPEQHRDHVSELIIFEPISGLPMRGVDPVLIFDFDQLQVDRVEAEPVLGWAVTPGKLSYSHLGYAAAGEKFAISSDPGLASFTLLDAASGATAFSGPAQRVETRLGRYAVLDFSSVVRPGLYRLSAGSTASEPFIIGEPWLAFVETTLNAFYGMRCGFAVPGVHDACHCDVFVRYKGETRIVGGGWHDAANLTQGPGRTHLSIYALLELHDALSPLDAALADRAMEEALWGLEWSLRMRFGPGLRCLYGVYSFYTDSVIGNEDDVVEENVGVDTFQNIMAVLSSARAARALKARNPHLARQALQAAEEDFLTCLRDRPQPPSGSPPIGINEGAWRDEIGYLTLAAAELFRATQNPAYRDHAARLGRWLMDLQETRFIDGSPVTGYFYEDAARTRIIHEYHNSFEECGPTALAALCDCFPDHPDWIDWYAGLVTYSEYFCRKGAEASAPFGVLAAAVWRRADLDAAIPIDRGAKMFGTAANAVFPTPPTPELTRRQMGEEFDAAAHLSPDQRLRVFPLWYDHVRHGSSVVQLSKAAGLGAAARLRRRFDLADLCGRQLMWILGANPFSRSIVYGVGHDWWQNFTVAMPSLVGGMSLGVNCYASDAPAWGNNAVFPYKEQWIFSSCRHALNLAHLAGVARVSGSAPKGAVFHEVRTGARTPVEPGPYQVELPPGDYEISYGPFRRRRGFASGGVTSLGLDPSAAIEIRIDEAYADGRLRVTVEGAGAHRLDVRASNLDLDQQAFDVVLDGAPKTLDLPMHLKDASRPWVLVVTPAGRPSEWVEAFGAAQPAKDLSAA